MICNYCRKEINDDSKFCQYCGRMLYGKISEITRFNTLNNKSKEELIVIIRRKDNSEKSLNRKIQELIKELATYKKENTSEALGSL